MIVVVRQLNGRIEEFEATGENMTLGLGGTLLPCICGARNFAEPGPEEPPDQREPDHICGCGRRYWYYESEAEQLGYLH